MNITSEQLNIRHKEVVPRGSEPSPLGLACHQRPGGRVLVLEFSKPTSALLGKLYDQYSFQILPAMGRLIAQDAESYRYLAESIRQHPDQETLLEMMETAGFANCRYHNMTGGVVALHQGFKA